MFGQGEVDLLWIHPWFSHLEILWEHPPIERFYREMASFARVILLDQRGVGLSDRSKGLPDLETRMDDLRAVLDAARSERPVLWGGGNDGGALCAMYAATYPDRVAALAFWNASAKSLASSDYPFGDTREEIDSWMTLIAEGWGREERTAEIMVAAGGPSLATDPQTIRWAAKASRYMGSPGDVLAFSRMWEETDFRAICPSIHVPAICIYADEVDRPQGNRSFEDLAARIAGQGA